MINSRSINTVAPVHAERRGFALLVVARSPFMTLHELHDTCRLVLLTPIQSEDAPWPPAGNDTCFLDFHSSGLS